MRAVFVFLAVALADALWGRYLIAASSRQAGIASLYSAGIILVGGFTTIAYVDDPRYLLPACLGAVVGTYYAVKRG